MKIKLINELNPNYSPIEQVLYNRLLPEESFNSFINFEYFFHSYKLLPNIDKAVNCLLKHIKNNSNIYCIVDSDCDGITSSASIISYLQTNIPNINIKYIMHPDKEHGIVLNEIPKDCQLLISPDGGSDDILQSKTLYEKGVEIIVLDHHHYDIDSDNPAIIVNSTNNYPNMHLCGAAVVYKFLEALDEKLNLSSAENYIDLCALGLVADMMPLTELENLSLINKGLLNINNKLFKAILEKQSFMTKDVVNPISIAFYVAPLINAVIRSGTIEEKAVVFEAFIDPDKEIISTKRGHQGEIESAKEQALRCMTNCKNRQDKEVTKYTEKIKSIIAEKNLLDNKILLVTIDFEINKNIIGLIANKLASLYSRPALILREKENKYVGSARNPANSEIENLRKELDDLNSTEYSRGHSSAFGLSISEDNLENFISQTEELFKNISYEDILYVDFCFNKNCKAGLILELNKFKYLYGNSMSEPKISIYNLEVNNYNCAIMGKSSDTIKITDGNGIAYMLFRQSEESVSLFKEKLKSGTFMINIVGRGNINEWNGRITEQIFIDSYEISNKRIF